MTMIKTRRAMLAAALGGGAALGAGPLWAKKPAKPAFKLVMLGDSLIAGLGLKRPETIPFKLQEVLASQGLSVRVVNAGVSGETSANVLARLDFSVPADAGGVIIAAGANDMLQGLSPALLRDNLGAMVERLQKRRLMVALAGMRAQAGLGASFRRQFDAVYPAIAQEFKIALYPFLLEGVALKEVYNQDDAIHPNAQGAKIIAQNLAPFAISTFQLRRFEK
jgi:acyl-CoA thioesterase-1